MLAPHCISLGENNTQLPQLTCVGTFLGAAQYSTNVLDLGEVCDTELSGDFSGQFGVDSVKLPYTAPEQRVLKGKAERAAAIM